MVARYKNFGEYLLAKRVVRGMATQAELARQVGAAQQTVSRWEAGTSRPRPDELPKIAAALKIDAAELAHAAGYAPEMTTASFDRPLPLASLQPESFEYFCLDLLATHYGPEVDVHPAGKTGHKQHGIDIEARFLDGTSHTFQCKREAQFGAAKVRKAIEAQTVPAQRKVILLSRVASPDARNEVKRAHGWDLWDQTDITRIFRTLPKQQQVRIVDIFFPTQRFTLTGELAPGPWLTVDAFFAPQLAEGRIFNQRWDLVGRIAELDHLVHAFANLDVVAVSLIGRAGEGKSRVLRAALDSYRSTHPNARVIVASPTEEITTKSLEDLGGGEKLIVADDVHDRSDLPQLIRYVADDRSQARLLLVYRPYWTEVVQRELGRYGLTGKFIESITLAKPTKADALALATQVLEKDGAPVHSAAAIAALAYDSPLAVVVGAQIVSKEGVHPELFGSNEEFRSTVLKHYENVIAKGIATGKDQERVHAILRVLALVQPVVPDDRHFLELLSTVESIDGPDASRLVRLLIDAGVLFSRGLKFRLSPDLLADSIIESACITSGGSSNGYAERVFAAAVPEQKEHVLLNLGRLDWRRNEGDTSTSRLLDGLWSQLDWEDDYAHAQVKAAGAAAYYQPRQALSFARRLVDQGHGNDQDVCRMVREAAYNLDYLPDACSLLWQAGQNDVRPTSQHPNHPIRVLTELCTPEPRKPAEFVEEVVDFALSLMDFPESWQGQHTPFDVLRGALATDGQFTSAGTSRGITISTYAVHRERVEQVRQRIVTELLASFAHPNLRRAFVAAQLLGDALRGPMAARGGQADSWGDEFLATLQKLDALLDTAAVTPPVLVRIAESVGWHAFYGPDRTSITAHRIIERLNRDIETRTIRALMDAWGNNTWPLEEQTGRPQHEADSDALCRELAIRYPEPAALEQFIRDRLDDIGRATGSADYGSAQLFIGRLLSTNLEFARHLAHASLSRKNAPLSSYGGRALGVLLTSSRDEATSLVSRMLEEGKAHLQVIAEGYMFAQNLAPHSEVDIVALKCIFASRDGAILRYAPHVAHEVARSDKLLAVELLTSVDVDLALRSARDFFMWLTHEQTIPFDLIRHDQLCRVIEGLRTIERIDDHWLTEFLKKTIRRAPGIVLDLAKTRIEDATAADDWSKPVLGGVLRDGEALELLKHSDGPALLRDLLDWALGRIDDYGFTYRFAELVHSLCNPYDATCVATVEGWLAEGTAEHFKVVTAILRDAGSRFIYSNEGFVARALQAARAVGRNVHKNLSSAIFVSAVTGLRAGAPGQPFNFDIQLKTMAEERLARLTKIDPAFGLYRDLRDSAARDIEQQLALGRRMDEEDTEA